MAKLIYSSPPIRNSTGYSTTNPLTTSVLEPDDINANLTDVAQVLNGGLSGYNFSPACKIANALIVDYKHIITLTAVPGAPGSTAWITIFVLPTFFTNRACNILGVYGKMTSWTGGVRWLCDSTVGTIFTATNFSSSGLDADKYIDSIQSPSATWNANHPLKIQLQVSSGSVDQLNIVLSMAHVG